VGVGSCERNTTALKKQSTTTAPIHPLLLPLLLPSLTNLTSISRLRREHIFPTMSLDPPTYIFALQNNIRARPISWEGAVRARTITDADLKKIKSIDKVRKEHRKQTIEADVDSFVALLLGGNGSPSIFEAAAKRQDIIQYMLVLTGDLLDGTTL
jgi:hypothetical protein